MSIISRPPEMAKREYDCRSQSQLSSRVRDLHPEYAGSRRRFRTEDRDRRYVEFRWLRPPEKGRTFSRGWRGTSIRKQMPSETPRWLVIPERDLFTGIAIVGAVTSEKSKSELWRIGIT
jgi:hypothetical protein